MTTLADARSTASATSVSTDGASRDPVDVAGAGRAGATRGRVTVAALGTAPSTRHIVATCGGGLVSRVVAFVGRLNTTGGAAAAGDTVAGVPAMLGTAVTEDTPGTCG